MAKVTLTIISNTGGTTNKQTGLFDIGVAVNITAIPKVGYDFLGWYDGTTTTTNPILTITPSVNITLTASYKLHDWTATDYSNLSNFISSYLMFAGIVGSSPNATMANKMLPYVVAIQNEKLLFDQAKLFGLNTAQHYANIVSILNSFNPDIIPIV